MKDDRLMEMRVFRAVVETGSFTGAAHALGASQPFISQTISSLERRLGVQLLHRSTRTQRLTVEGEHFLASCREILDSLEEAEAQIRSAEPTGDLRVSAPQAFGLDQVVPALPAFVTRYPALTLHFSLSDARVNLIEDNFDVAVRMGRLQNSPLRSRKLCNLQRIVVAAPAYLERYGAPVTPHGLARSDVAVKLARPAGWQDGRSARKTDDASVVEEIRQAVAHLPSYGYRRVRGLLRRQRESQGATAVNAKRVYRVMRTHGLLLQRQPIPPRAQRRHDGKVAVSRSNRRWCSDGFEFRCENGERSPREFRRRTESLTLV